MRKVVSKLQFHLSPPGSSYLLLLCSTELIHVRYELCIDSWLSQMSQTADSHQTLIMHSQHAGTRLPRGTSPTGSSPFPVTPPLPLPRSVFDKDQHEAAAPHLATGVKLATKGDGGLCGVVLKGRRRRHLQAGGEAAGSTQVR